MRELVGISLDEFNSMKEKYLAGEKIFDSDTTYVLDLENFNGITTQMLESLENFPIDVKFNIEDDMYNQLKYYYDIGEAKEMVSTIEEIGKNMPNFCNDYGKFLYIYVVLASILEYKDLIPSEQGKIISNKELKDEIQGGSLSKDKLEKIKMKLDKLSETQGRQRGAYSSLVNGDGVCQRVCCSIKNSIKLL